MVFTAGKRRGRWEGTLHFGWENSAPRDFWINTAVNTLKESNGKKSADAARYLCIL